MATSPEPFVERDARLLDALAQGNVETLGELYDLYGAGAYRLALKLGGDVQVAEQVVARAFVTLWERVRHGARPETAASWLAAFVSQHARDAVDR